MAGRKSKLTDEQWASIGKRILEGESIRALAREHGVGEATIRDHFDRKGQDAKTIQQVATQLFEAETAMKQLPVVAQAQARTLANRMRAISEDLAHAAELNSKTALRLSALANEKAGEIDDAKPLDNPQPLRETVALMTAANQAMSTPLNLLAANREFVKRVNEEQPAAEEAVTPQRLQDGARRIAFTLARAARNTTEQTS